MAKMDKKWIILCSTAVAAIYTSGYVAIENPVNNIQIPKHLNTQASELHSSKPPSLAEKKSKYKDGSFQGAGMNRRGMIEVTVTIKKDKITDVEISNFGMHYSESDIVDLPKEVLQYQSSQVNNVSGATYSTQAFEDAVQDALSKAENV
ncbi:MAG: FMN-binding protein [Heyndrickxia sp.]